MKLPQISTPDALKKKPSLGGVKARDLKNLKVPDFKNLKVPDLTSLKVSDLVNLGLGRSAGSVVGLDIQPGFIAAVQGRGNGSVVVEKAAAMSLSPDTLRHGEVNDEGRLAEALRELFGESGLSKRVRVGIANQRTVLRTLELPPVTDAKELAAAVNFQAQEQVPMPLNNAVLDFHALGVVNTPAGPRQQVVLVAAQRDMVERLLGAIEQAGLIPVGIDLSAFALIRSLYAPESDIPAEGEEGEGVPRVLYLNVDGLTNLAIAEGPVCRFTRVVGGGIESMAAELAAKREISTPEARALLFAANLAEAAGAEEWGPAAPPRPAPEMTPAEAVADEHPSVTRESTSTGLRPRSRVPGRAGRGRVRRFRTSPRATVSSRPITPSSRQATTTPAKRRATRPPMPRPPTPAALRATTTRTSTACSRAASATSTGRSATRSTSTAPRRAGERSPTSSSAVRPRTSPASRTPSRPRSASRSGRVKSSSRATPATASRPTGWLSRPGWPSRR